MTEEARPAPDSRPHEEERDASSLLPMLVGGLGLITIGMIAVALVV